jgi:hypothetical protein
MFVSAIYQMRSLLAATGLRRESLRAAAGVLLRGALLGTALYLMIGNDPFANLKLNGVSYIAAVVWSFYDGVLARRKWSTAWLEGLFMHLAGIQMGNILAFVFGYPVWVV